MLYVQVHIHILLFQSQKGIHKGDGERKIVREKEGEGERERERERERHRFITKHVPIEAH